MNIKTYYLYKQAAGEPKKYTQDEFDKIIADYEKQQRKGKPGGSKEDIQRGRQEERRKQMDEVNDGIVKARERSIGIRNAIPTFGAMGGWYVGSKIADLLGADVWHDPNKPAYFVPKFLTENLPENPADIEDVPYLTNARKWYNRIVGWGSRIGGATIGWLTPLLLSRIIEGTGDYAQAGYNKYSSR